MKRIPTDYCLLCQKEHSTKENSHIVPKFMGKSILGKEKRGGIVDSSLPLQRIQIKQDSPKENYILCPNCERYFEILETYSAERLFKRILNPTFNDDFEYQISEGEIEYAECKHLDNLAFRLFIISIFWRCSISTIPPFTKFQIENEEYLRQILVEFKTFDIKIILNQANPGLIIYDTPIVILRAKNASHPESHFYYANSLVKGSYQLFLNEYIFILSLEKASSIVNFDFLNNVADENLRIGLLRNDIWVELTNGLLDMVKKKSIENIERIQTLE